MAGWVEDIELEISKFCRDHQQTIEENTPFLDPARRQKMIDALNDCARKAKEAEGSKIGFMRRELHPLVQQVRFMTGNRMRIS